MKHLVAVLALLSACSPIPPSRDAGNCPDALTLGVLARGLAPVGLQYFWVTTFEPDAGDAVISVSVSRDGGVIGSSAPGRGIDIPTPGDISVRAEISCGGRVLDELEFDERIYPELPSLSTRRVLRSCQAFARLTSAPNETFDCDGVVVDSNGIAVPSRVSGAESRIVHDGAVRRRWVRTGDLLHYESENGLLGPAPFSNEQPWLVTQGASIAGRTLATANDGGFSLHTFDAGTPFSDPRERYEPCAIAKRDDQLAIALCTVPGAATGGEPPSDQEILICRIQPMAELVDCELTTRMIFVRQEPNSQRVLLRRDRQLFWLDLFTPTVEIPARTLRGTELLAGPRVFGTGEQPTLFHPSELTVAGAVLTSDVDVLVIRDDERVHASSEVVWYSEDGQTRWAEIP